MNEEYTDDQIEEWTREDLLNPPLLSDEEIQELRNNKRQLTAQATQKLRKLKAQQQTQELLNAAHRVSDGGVPLGKGEC
jgi:bisphosphoglycerate-dependent phosphoglycerate mutase